MSSVSEEFVGFPTFKALPADAFELAVASLNFLLWDFCFDTSEGDCAFDAVVEFGFRIDFALDALGDNFSFDGWDDVALDALGGGFSFNGCGDFALDALVGDLSVDASGGDFAFVTLGGDFSFDDLGGNFSFDGLVA